jgi:predicted nucleic acid-binding protein
VARTDGALIDANVLLDLVTHGNPWQDWSADMLRRVAASSRLIVNDVIYAEVSIGFRAIEEVDAVLAETRAAIAPIPRPALFRAGKAFREYRRRGGTRTGVLPDFVIGAHAEASGLRLLTRDAARYRTYFPDVVLITP